MKIKRTAKWVSLISFLCLSLIASAFWVFRANAQNQSINDLDTRLKEKGIPIISMVVTRRIPFDIKIVIQSKSIDKNLQPDDLYNAQIARKAATLFYRHGQRIDGYELEIINSKGKTINWESNNIFPKEISQQNLSIVPSKLSDNDTTLIVQTELKLHSLSLEKINIVSDQTLGDVGQELYLQLSTPDINTANQDLITFLLSIHDTIDGINTKYGTRITLCWIRVFDKENTQLLNYVWDVETREETSIQAPGLAAWYPVPAPVSTEATSNTPVNTPIPSGFNNNVTQSYPGPTPTNHPYP